MQLAVLLFDRVTALDAIGPIEVLGRVPGTEVVTVAVEPGPVRTDLGVGLVADRALDDVRDPDVVLVPGGPGTRALLGDGPVRAWLTAVHPRTRWTTSVCTGSLVLAAAGVLDGLEATTHWRELDTLGRLGARPVEQRVVEQDRIITAAGVSAGIDLALTLAARIAGDDVARAIQLGIEYDPQPPFDAGSVAKAGPEIVGLVEAAMPRPETPV